MTTPMSCPWCDADLRGTPIPADLLPLFGSGQAPWFSLANPIREDGKTKGFQCPSCEFAWLRGEEPAILAARRVKKI